MTSRKILIDIIVFVAGALVMIFEIAGSRVLGPYLGTSVFVWTSLIGIILASLSLGYYLGGRLADQKPRMEVLCMILFLSAVFVAITTLIKEDFLIFIQEQNFDLRSGAVIAAGVLFLPASFLLGMVSPYAVKLNMDSLKTSGTTVGSLYALSTLGSIFGTFFAGFYLIPAFGTNRILVFLVSALVLLSLLGFGLGRGKKALAVVVVLAGAALGSNAFAKEGIIDRDTSYNRVWIYDEHHPRLGLIRRMKVNNENSSAMFLEKEGLVFEYTKYYHLIRHFNPGFQKSLMIGGAAYSYPKDYLRQYPRVTLDVVEIDPGLTELARDYFDLKDDPRLRIFHEDGRIFLNRSREKYDAILGDAFRSQYSLPYQLTTQEAVQRKYDLLNENGVVLVNIISAIEGDKGQFLRAEVATYKSIFPQVHVLGVQAPRHGDLVQNLVLVALKSEVPPSFFSTDSELNAWLGHVWQKDIPTDIPLLTDDFAPVDHYVSKTF